jgi:uncharacterized membrane protein
MLSFRWLLLIGIVLMPLLWALWLTEVVSFSFARLGLSPAVTALVLLGSLAGGWINIPIWRRRIRLPTSWDGWQVLVPWSVLKTLPGRSGWFYYRPPRVREQVIAINLGGALIPLAIDLLLLPRAPVEPLLGAVAGVAAASYALARPAWPVGIVLPPFVPPLTAALLAEVIAPGAAPVVAYIAGTLGTLVGADLLHLPDLERFEAQLLSIGGAGVHDGIFFAGVVAALLT